MKTLIIRNKRLHLGCLLALFVMSFLSCEKEERRGERLEQSMALYTTSASLLIGEEITVKPKFAPGVTPKRMYEWTVDNPDIISMVTNEEDYSATITALAEGQTKLTIASTDGVLSVTCPVQVIDGTTDIYVSFDQGGTNGAFMDGWNLLSQYLEGGAITDLKTKKGYSSNISMTVTKRVNRFGSSTVGETDTELNMPLSVSESLFYGNSGTAINSLITGESVLTLVGFDKKKVYDFYFYGSNQNSGTRSVLYTVAGMNEGSDELNAAGNTSNLAYIPNIQPDDNGMLTVTIKAAEGNGTTQKLYYINAMR